MEPARRRWRSAGCFADGNADRGRRAPASAAPLQDFTLAKNGGNSDRPRPRRGRERPRHVHVLRLHAPHTLTFPSRTVDLTTSPSTHVEKLDPRTCRATVSESGTFSFDTSSGQILEGGSGPYTLAGTRQGTRTASGCAFPSADLTQFSLIARSTEIHASCSDRGSRPRRGGRAPVVLPQSDAMGWVTVGAVQATPVFLDSDATVEKAVRLIEEAAGEAPGWWCSRRRSCRPIRTGCGGLPAWSDGTLYARLSTRPSRARPDRARLGEAAAEAGAYVVDRCQRADRGRDALQLAAATSTPTAAPAVAPEAHAHRWGAAGVGLR